jgi:hypothetical protein
METDWEHNREQNRMPKFDADKWIAISAMVVSVGTLFALSYQSLLMRESERASKLPYLYFSLLSNSQQGVEILLSNSGIGPAIVDDVQIHYEGRDLTADPYDFFMGLSEENRKNGAGVDKVQKGRLIPAGTAVQMLQFAPGPNGMQTMLAPMLKLFDFADVPREWYSRLAPADLKHGVIEIKYSSVFGERWRIRSDRVVPDHL